jgi:hypothetical protein
MIEPRIRAVVFREGDWWIIQILEYDLVTQVRHLEDVPGEFRRLLIGQMAANAALGVEPFHGFSEAPRRFWKMYEHARALVTPTPLEAILLRFGVKPEILRRKVIEPAKAAEQADRQRLILLDEDDEGPSILP